MNDIDEQISRIERLYREITGNDPKQGNGEVTPFPPGVNPEEYVRENLRRLEWAARRQPPPAVAAPRITIFENERDWSCAFEIPGVKKSELSVEMGEGTLRVSASREIPIQGTARILYSDASVGRFQRELPLPQHLDAESLEARLENGLLVVTFRKVPSNRPRDRRIEVS
jgi:HSP20 family molecular chaperone IbpA